MRHKKHLAFFGLDGFSVNVVDVAVLHVGVSVVIVVDVIVEDEGVIVVARDGVSTFGLITSSTMDDEEVGGGEETEEDGGIWCDDVVMFDGVGDDEDDICSSAEFFSLAHFEQRLPPLGLP